MIVLAIDTCDSRGSVALMSGGTVLHVVVHDTPEDYSAWLVPAVERSLLTSGLGMRDVEAYVVASGPGSFTGLRVGLTTVKAWCEVYGRPIATVSRLEAIAWSGNELGAYVAAFADAHRGQVFGAVYRRNGALLERLGEEMVIARDKFVEWAANQAKGEQVSWVSIDPEVISSESAWMSRKSAGEKMEPISSVLAPTIGLIGTQRLAAGLSTDILALDANYVRRTDAELFWKDGLHHGH